MIYCVLLKTGYNVELLKNEVLQFNEGKFINKTLQWKGISLRNKNGKTDGKSVSLISNKTDGKSEFKNTIELEKTPYIKKILDEISKEFNTSIGLVRILRLEKGAKINKHRDGINFDLNFGKAHRLHIPIITDEKVDFFIAGNNYYLKQGNLYFTNVSYYHNVDNRSNVDRIHLVIDIVATKHTRSIIKKYDPLPSK